MACVIKARHRLAGNTIGLLPSAHLLKATTFGRNFDIWIIYNLKLAAQFWRNYRVEKLCGYAIVYNQIHRLPVLRRNPLITKKINWHYARWPSRCSIWQFDPADHEPEPPFVLNRIA